MEVDPCAMDETTSPVYSADDIRLCTMHRATRDQSFGLILRYHRHEGFHYVTLLGDPGSNLAHSAGVRSFDRLIEFNGMNIETDSADALSKRLNDVDTLYLHLLVCSPATYMHYKAKGVPLHRHLDTVKSKLVLVVSFPRLFVFQISRTALLWRAMRTMRCSSRPVKSPSQTPSTRVLNKKASWKYRCVTSNCMKNWDAVPLVRISECNIEH
jgi:hypothetical protein